ncbi:MAG: YeeE/YedE family protein [Deferribacteraceae bacterium]|jgi:uncharacterized membrane protein YedE/YeeE|nr:YeeE/YedE family protein [Deferribacteraceae bacterium]
MANPNSSWQKISAPIIFALSIIAAYCLSSLEGGRVTAFAFIIGFCFGFVMKKSRFCFYCHIRDYIEHKNCDGVLALIIALAVGSIGYTIVMASWIPNPTPNNIPPDIHVGPVSEILFLAGVIFGIGMVLSRSCISAHWYHLSEGAFSSLFALLGVAFGFFLAFNAWNPLYSIRIAYTPIIWLPARLGYAGALALQILLLGAAAALVWRFSDKKPPENRVEEPPANFSDLYNHFFAQKWHYYTGAIIIGILGFLLIIWTKPLGVTASIASWVRAFGSAYALIPSRLDGLDGFAGCGSLPSNFWLNTDNLLLLGLILGSFSASLGADGFKARLPRARWAALNFIGGVLLGFGAMLSLGCTIGTLLSGIHAGALSGWIFALGILFSIWGSLRIKRAVFLKGK